MFVITFVDTHYQAVTFAIKYVDTNIDKKAYCKCVDGF